MVQDLARRPKICSCRLLHPDALAIRRLPHAPHVRSLSPDIREAAKIDGANDHQLSRYITIPMIKPVLRMCVIFAVTGSLKAFDLIYVLTGGGPAHASEVPSTLMINMIFDRSRYGLGSSIAMFIIFLCFFFAILIKRCFRTEVD